MAEDRKPAAIRIDVPEEFGSVYTNADGSRQYVERRQQIGRGFHKELEDLTQLFTEEEQFDKACKVFQWLFTDWDLADDSSGSLPKPWQNPKAFAALADMDLDLTLWVLGLIRMTMAQLIALQSGEEDLKN